MIKALCLIILVSIIVSSAHTQAESSKNVLKEIIASKSISDTNLSRLRESMYNEMGVSGMPPECTSAIDGALSATRDGNMDKAVSTAENIAEKCGFKSEDSNDWRRKIDCDSKQYRNHSLCAKTRIEDALHSNSFGYSDPKSQILQDIPKLDKLELLDLLHTLVEEKSVLWISVLEVLLKNKDRLNLNIDGLLRNRTALMSAAMTGNSYAVEQLLRFGANPQVTSKDGLSVYDILLNEKAPTSGHFLSLVLLTNRGFDLDSLMIRYTSPLILGLAAEIRSSNPQSSSKAISSLSRAIGHEKMFATLWPATASILCQTDRPESVEFLKLSVFNGRPVLIQDRGVDKESREIGDRYVQRIVDEMSLARLSNSKAVEAKSRATCMVSAAANPGNSWVNGRIRLERSLTEDVFSEYLKNESLPVKLVRTYRAINLWILSALDGQRGSLLPIALLLAYAVVIVHLLKVGFKYALLAISASIGFIWAAKTNDNLTINLLLPFLLSVIVLYSLAIRNWFEVRCEDGPISSRNDEVSGIDKVTIGDYLNQGLEARNRFESDVLRELKLDENDKTKNVLKLEIGYLAKGQRRRPGEPPPKKGDKLFPMVKNYIGKNKEKIGI